MNITYKQALMNRGCKPVWFIYGLFDHHPDNKEEPKSLRLIDLAMMIGNEYHEQDFNPEYDHLFFLAINPVTDEEELETLELTPDDVFWAIQKFMQYQDQVTLQKYRTSLIEVFNLTDEFMNLSLKDTDLFFDLADIQITKADIINLVYHLTGQVPDNPLQHKLPI